MDPDDAVIRAFLERLDKGEMNGQLNFELSKLSYAQLVRVSQILAQKIENQKQPESTPGLPIKNKGVQ